MDAYWRAANYVSVGQIYLYDMIRSQKENPGVVSEAKAIATGLDKDFQKARCNPLRKLTGPSPASPMPWPDIITRWRRNPGP